MELQRTEDWRLDRCGYITASSAYKLMAGKTTAEYQNYLAQIVSERLTGVPSESFTNSAMEWGVETEELARVSYELSTGFNVEQVGFIKLDDMIGASPDGLVGDDGLIEIKCPNTSTHLATLLEDKIDKKYIYQMQLQMYVTGREWCDFVSYDPRLTGKAQMKVINVVRNQATIEALIAEAKLLNSRANEMLKEIEDINDSVVKPKKY